MIRDLLALRPISQFTQTTLSYLHSTKIEQMTKTMVILKTGAIFLCCIRCDPIPRQTSVQRLAHTRNVTTCCCDRQPRSQLVPRFLSVSRVEHAATGRGREGREDNVESQASSYIFVAFAACRRRKGQRIERKGGKEGDWDLPFSLFSPPLPFLRLPHRLYFDIFKMSAN